MPESNQSAEHRSVLLKYATYLLNRRPYFTGQLRQKLKQKSQKLNIDDIAIIDKILEDLTKAKYLNDEYLILGYVKQKLKKLQGPKVIAFKLKQLGLSQKDIQNVLSLQEIQIAIDEAKQQISAKYLKLDSFKIKSKLYQRGF